MKYLNSPQCIAWAPEHSSSREAGLSASVVLPVGRGGGLGLLVFSLLTPGVGVYPLDERLYSLNLWTGGNYLVFLAYGTNGRIKYQAFLAFLG